MCDWPKSDCDVSVTDRQTDKHFGFWAITFETPSHQGARGLRPRALVFGELTQLPKRKRDTLDTLGPGLRASDISISYASQ